MFKQYSYLKTSILSKDIGQFIEKIVFFIDNLQWDKAKEIWIVSVMKLLEKPIQNSISLSGSDRVRFFYYIKDYQKHSLIQICAETCEYNRKFVLDDDSFNIYFKKLEKSVSVYSGVKGKCAKCKNNKDSFIFFKSKPPFLFIQSPYNNIFYNELSQVLSIDNLNFKYVSSVVYDKENYLGVFNLKNDPYLVNSADKSMINLKSDESLAKSKKIAHYLEKNAISSSLYMLTE
jgi:hypothetical protein